MYLSLANFYWYKDVKGFYIFGVGDGDFDSALLGFHIRQELDYEMQVKYRTYSIDILWLSLIKKTLSDIFKKEDK